MEWQHNNSQHYYPDHQYQDHHQDQDQYYSRQSFENTEAAGPAQTGQGRPPIAAPPLHPANLNTNNTHHPSFPHISPSTPSPPSSPSSHSLNFDSRSAANPFDDRFHAPSAASGTNPVNPHLLAVSQNSPPRQSEFYDTFLEGYIDSYNNNRKSQLQNQIQAQKSSAADMAYNGGHGPGGRQQWPQPGPPGFSDNRNRSMQNSYEDMERQPQHHTPYRDMSSSPELHPGFDTHTGTSRSSPPRFAQPQPSRYNSPSRQADGNNHNIPLLGGGPFADPARPLPSPTQYTAYNPSLSPDNRSREFDSGGRNSPLAPYGQSSQASFGSGEHLATVPGPPIPPSHGQNSRGVSPHNFGPPNNPYQNPYDAHSISRNNLNGLDYIDPTSLADDGDEGLEYHNPKRRSVLSLQNLNRRSMNSSSTLGPPGVGAAGAAAATGGATVAAASMLGPRRPSDLANSTVPEPETAEKAFPPMKDPVVAAKNKKWKRLLFFLVVLVVLGGVAAGVVVTLLKKGAANGGIGPGSSSSSSGNGSGGTTTGSDSGTYDLNSPAVQAVMNNTDLHKVFMGMAYTPMNTQYPGCVSLAPIQNNVTLDLAVLSQLTNVIRLYGTDCNQTELVLTAINQLKLPDMKIWAGIWLNNNVTTNTRQVEQFWNVVDKYGTANIKGVIVGNEVLFREDLTLIQLEQYVTDVRTNMTSRGINIPVASADLGDNWTAQFASKVDVVMSNVHPFFAGVPAAQGASWAWDFWQTHDVILTPNAKQGQQIISEIGWPSQGGNDCGTAAPCPNPTDGSIAGITEMNTFMGVWVCQALANQTEYFWFEGYDEPWKIAFDTAGQAWEDHWGLLDVNRNLKSGVTIPSCNGNTLPAS